MRGVLGILLLAQAFAARAETVQTLSSAFIPRNIAVAGLPTCNAANAGVVYRVIDALVPALNVAVVGGGGVAVIVRCNATSWLVGQ